MKKGFLMLMAAIFLAFGCDKNKNTPQPAPGEKDGITNLSANGTANSYMVPKAGKYKFDATVMGNGVSTRGINAQTLAPATAELLWQDTKGVVSGIEIKDNTIVFDAGEAEGNAVIAAKDASGKIIWSWHIWRTAYNPADNASAHEFNGVVWMTRNLGAKSDTWDEIGTAKGLMYQWGRKDPFPSLDGWTDNGNFTVFNEAGDDVTESIKTEVVSASDNLGNSISNPTTFYSGVRGADGNGPYDWITTEDYSLGNDYLWEAEGTGAKTLMDPCPPGYRIPANILYKGLNNNSFPLADDINGGRYHDKMGYFPPCGSRGFEGGTWFAVGLYTDYWSSTAMEDGWAGLLHGLESNINPKGKTYRAAGAAVRCVSEARNGEEPSWDKADVTINAIDAIETAYIKNNGSDGSANYYFGLTNTNSYTVNDKGLYVPGEGGEIVFFDIYGAPSKDSENAILPEGTYTLGSMSNSGTADTDYTREHYSIDGQLAFYEFTDGEIKVTHTPSGYHIEALMTRNDSQVIKVVYDGAIKFVNRGAPDVGTVITNPVDVTFTIADIVYEHSSTTDDKYDRYSINLFAGEMQGEAVLTNGYAVHIDLFTDPFSSKGNVQLKPGTYKAGNEFKAGTYMPGAYYNLMGVPLYAGTYCMEVRPTNTAVLYGLIQKGDIKVERSGDNYEITIDCVSEDGVSIKGKFPMGEANLRDNSPNLPDGDWNSILREDKTLIFNETDDIFSYMNHYCYDDHSEYEIIVNNHTSDESFYLSVVAAANASSPVGTFTTPKDASNPTIGEFRPGYRDFSAYKDTWCYMTFDSDGYEAGGAPATEGTITIKDAGDGKYTIEFELKDDADPKHTIKALWTGKFNKENEYR